MIVRSEHSFGPGYADSTIQAKWVASTEAFVTQGPEDEKETVLKGKAKYCFAADDRKKQRDQAAKRKQKKESADMMAEAGDMDWFDFIPDLHTPDGGGILDD